MQSRRLSQTADRNAERKAYVRQEGYVGRPLRQLQLTCSELIIRFRQGYLELLLKLLILCF